MSQENVDVVRRSVEAYARKTTPEEFIDAGERVLATVRFNGRGSASGVDVEARSYTVYTMRDGKIIAMEEFIERTDALVAAGLRE